MRRLFKEQKGEFHMLERGMMHFNHEYFFVVVESQNTVAAVKLLITLVSCSYLCSLVKTRFLHHYYSTSVHVHLKYL